MWPTSACTASPVELALNELWIKNIDISMGLVNTNTLAMLLSLVAEHKLPADKFVTHTFAFDGHDRGLRGLRQRGRSTTHSRC